jgi:hypothetical protein
MGNSILFFSKAVAHPSLICYNGTDYKNNMGINTHLEARI